MDFLKGADGTEVTFWCFAIFGTVFFFLRVMLMVVGGFGAEDLDGDVDGDLDMDPDGDLHGGHETEAHHSDSLTASDAAFKLLSIHTLTGFFMMLGWVGLTCYKQFGLSAPISSALAFVGGIATMYMIAFMYKTMLSLASPGARFNIEDMVGKNATVYQRILDDGVGQVQYSDKGISRTVDAVSEDKKTIDSFEMVEVVRVMSPRRVMVKIKRKAQGGE